MPRPSTSNALLIDTIMPSNNSFETISKVHVSPLPHIPNIFVPDIPSNPNPVLSTTTILDPLISDQNRRYPLQAHKQLDRLAFSKLSHNIVYPISDLVSYHRLYKTHLAFAFQISSMSLPNHFQEALEDPK